MKHTAVVGALACALVVDVLMSSCRTSAPAYPETIFAVHRAPLRGAPEPARATSLVAADLATPAKFQCSPNQTITYGPTVPGDNTAMADQTDADCFAWQEFIALNWPVSANTQGFGAPHDPAPVQWETFICNQLLFRPNAAPPPAWGSYPPVPPSCQATPNLADLRLPGAIRSLQMVSKGSGAFVPTEVSQAAPFNQPSWLGAQNGTNIWYEVVVDQDEYNYIAQNKLYDATAQAKFVNGGAGQPIVLPMGTRSNTTTGAIELKAAWLEVADNDYQNHVGTATSSQHRPCSIPRRASAATSSWRS